MILMPKEEMEFFDTERIPWVPIRGVKGQWEKILSRDEETGSYTRMLKFEPGCETFESLTHEFWEEVYIISGSLTDKAKSQEFTAGMYACRPPGMRHGPYVAPNGCITIEMRYTGFRGRTPKIRDAD